MSNSICPHRCEVQICETNVVKQPSLQGVVKTSGYPLRRLCLPESDRCQRWKFFITFLHLFPKFQLLYCLAHLHSFIYLLMWHFCYTEHVSYFIYIIISNNYVFFLKQPFQYIIVILFYIIIIIISVAVALAATFSLSDSLLTILFS